MLCKIIALGQITAVVQYPLCERPAAHPHACVTVGTIHPRAMPVMLAQSDYDRWLDSDHVDACALAAPYPDEQMKVVA